MPAKQCSSQPLILDPAYLRHLFQAGSRKDFLSAVRLALRRVLARLYVEGHYDQVISRIKLEACYRELNNTWEKLEPVVRSQKWQELLERLVQVAYATRPHCVRCGECCRQGSPSLHREDTELLSRGILSTRQIYTIRQKEPVRFNLEGRLGTIPDELIKLKEDSESGHCIFYVEQQRSCRIYNNRPLQCRTQACWSPADMEELWHREKLARRHLFMDDKVLMELLEAHDERCALESLDGAFEQFHRSGDVTALDRVVDLLRQDMAFRDLFRAELNRENEEMDLLLGRPLVNLVRAYRFRVEELADGTFRLVPDR